MADFIQQGLITTLHDMGTSSREQIEALLTRFAPQTPVGLILPVTASDMRAQPFERIIEELADAHFLQRILVVLNVTDGVEDYVEMTRKVAPLGDRGSILWTDGDRVSGLYQQLIDAGFTIGGPGKGRAVWTAFGCLLSGHRIAALALHDCDIVNYSRDLPARLVLPLVHPGLNFNFVKAYYARFTNRMHGRVVRLLVSPLVRGLTSVIGQHTFLQYLESFRYPLSGEFAVSSNLARSNRIPSDWGLEVGTLAEVYRNTSLKRVCQVDLCHQYEHKHQQLSLNDPGKGLMKMSTDILTTVFRTLASMGVVLSPSHFATLRSAYLRAAQDAIRQYHADALMNCLEFDRHEEEVAIEGFANQILVAGELFQTDPTGGEAIPNWTRVMAAFPDFPDRLQECVVGDSREFGG